MTLQRHQVTQAAFGNGVKPWLVVLGLLLVAGCGGSHPAKADKTAVASSVPSRQVSTPSATPSATAGPVTAITPSAGPSSAVKWQPPGATQNLTVTTQVRAQLVAAYETARKLPSDGVKGTSPGSVYYALDPGNGIHWAVAIFDPSLTLSSRQMVSFQDGGSIGVFREAPAAKWQLVAGGGAPVDCTGDVPANVRNAWHWSTGKGCGIGQ